MHLGKSGCIRAKWLYLGKMVVFGQGSCIGQNGCIGEKWLHLGKVVVFGQSGCIPRRVVVFG